MADLDSLEKQVMEHESKSIERFEHLKSLIETKETEMSTPVIENIFKPDAMAGMLPYLAGSGGSTAGAMGGGLGAGVLGGILGGALLGRRGVLGGGDDGAVGGVVTPALLASSLAQVTDTAQATTILQTLGDIKASVPLAESQVQLALAGSTADINKSIGMTENLLVQGQQNLSNQISAATASILASEGAIKETVLTVGAATLNAIKDAQFALSTTTRDDGDKTRALLIAQNDATLNRQLAVAEAALLEERSSRRARDVEINVTQQVNQQQAQAQQQQQVIGLTNLVSQLAAQFNRSQQDIINLGTMVGNTQSSANTNVR